MKRKNTLKFLTIVAMFVMAICACFGIGNTARAVGDANSGVQLDGGSFTFSKGTISGKKYGIFAVASSVTISGGTIRNNTGCGVAVGSSGSELRMTGGKIIGNGTDTESTGGGIVVQKVFNLDKGNIETNSALYGGGVYAGTCTFVMNNGYIYGNSATKQGGGVYLVASTMTMNDGYIEENSAEEEGGAVYINKKSTFIFNDGTIENNSLTSPGIACYGRLELNGGWTNDTIAVNADSTVVYNGTDVSEATFYLNDNAYITLAKAPTSDMRFELKSTITDGMVIAKLDSGVSASSTVLSHIKVTNLPSSMELVYSGNDIVLKYKTYTVTFTRNNSSYGSLSTYSVTVPYGTSYTTSSNKFNFSNGTTVTATAASASTQYTYGFSSWSSNSGTITADKTITATFSRSTRYYTVTLSRNDSSYGTLSRYSVSVPYNTTYSVSDNVITFSSGTSVTATPADSTSQYEYSFLSWSSTSGTITAAKTITANFTCTTRTYRVTFTTSLTITFADDNQRVPELAKTFVQNAIGGGGTYYRVSPTYLDVAYGTRFTSSSNTMTFVGVSGGTVTATGGADTTNGYAYDFVSWSPSSGTITGAEKITAKFNRRTTGIVTPLPWSFAPTVPYDVSIPGGVEDYYKQKPERYVLYNDRKKLPAILKRQGEI